jgi:hypothetical protein
MSGFQVVVAVFAINAGVLGVVFFAVYLLNKGVSQSGQ